MTSKFIACSLLFVLCISAVFTQEAATQGQPQEAVPQGQPQETAPQEKTQEAAPQAQTQEAAPQAQTQTTPQPTSALVNLTDENFNNHVTNTSSWLIMYYAPWCPHCKHALPNFEQFAQKVKSELNVGLVDCDDNTNIRSRFTIGGYPTFLYLRNGIMYPYKGPRTIEAWTDFVKEGYKNVEGEPMPMEASMLRTFLKEFGRFFEQLKYAAQAKPLLFGGIGLGFIILMALACFCGGPEEEKRPQQGEKRAQATQSAEKTAEQKKQE